MTREKIFIQGYGYSGCSVYSDFLYEFDNLNFLYKSEFDIPRSPGGLYEIGQLIETSSIYSKDSLVRRTLKLFDYFCSNEYNMQFWGEGFVKLCENFINKLVYFEAKSLQRYYGYTEQMRFPQIEYFNLYNNDLKELNRDTNTYYLNYFTKDEYIKLASEFLEDMMHLLPEKKTVLHHPLSIAEDKIDYQLPYWKDYKVLIVDRDPRDIYCTMQKELYANNQEYLKVNEDPERFVMQYKQKRQFHEHNLKLLGANGMAVFAEDFINNYDDVKKKIIEYFNLNEAEHINKLKYFNPEISKNNVGIYKNYKDQEAISIIEKGLSEFIRN